MNTNLGDIVAPGSGRLHAGLTLCSKCPYSEKSDAPSLARCRASPRHSAQRWTQPQQQRPWAGGEQRMGARRKYWPNFRLIGECVVSISIHLRGRFCIMPK
jgi:hypothetical protein